MSASALWRGLSLYSRGWDGERVRFVASTTAEALGAAEDEVLRLLEDGREHRKIALLTTGHRPPQQQVKTEQPGQDGCWSSFLEGEDVFFGHVLGSRGMERAAVVLRIHEAGDRDRAGERLGLGP